MKNYVILIVKNKKIQNLINRDYTEVEEVIND